MVRKLRSVLLGCLAIGSGCARQVAIPRIGSLELHIALGQDLETIQRARPRMGHDEYSGWTEDVADSAFAVIWYDFTPAEPPWLVKRMGRLKDVQFEARAMDWNSRIIEGLTRVSGPPHVIGCLSADADTGSLKGASREILAMDWVRDDLRIIVTVLVKREGDRGRPLRPVGVTVIRKMRLPGFLDRMHGAEECLDASSISW